MHRSVIVVAYHYPPENAIGAARPARFVKHLPAYGWDCQVFTAAKQPEVHSPSVFQIEDRTQSLWEEGLPAQGSIRFQRFGELLARRFLFPGAIALGWGMKAPKVIQRVVASRTVHASAVFSTFPPITTHSTGREVAKRLGLPWIADFRDPFVHEPVAVDGWMAQYTQRFMESRFMADATAVIMNTEPSADLYRRRYPQHAEKITTIWNGFDPEDHLAALPIPQRPRRSLRHVGVLYAGRTPLPIMQSFARLRSAGNAVALGWDVSLVGPYAMTETEQAVISQATSEGWTEVRNQKVPKAEAIRLIQESDGLFLIQHQSSVQVPAKLYEYISIGRPILALAPRNSSVEWVLSRCGIPCVLVYPDDPPEVVDGKLLAYLQLPGDPVAPSSWYQENFNAKHQTRQLADILDAAVALYAQGVR